MNTWERLQIVVAVVTVAVGMYPYILRGTAPNPEDRVFVDYAFSGVVTVGALALSAVAVGGVYSVAHWIIYGCLP